MSNVIGDIISLKQDLNFGVLKEQFIFVQL